MDWGQVITLLGGNLGIIITLILNHRHTTAEMKDFHGRLCRLEERYVLWMTNGAVKPESKGQIKS